jgi:hypothetical protein
MKKILLPAFLLLLSACSNEPSQVELKQAVQGQYDKFNSPSAALGATSPASQFVVHEVKKIGCKKGADAKAYSCDIEVDVTTPLVGRNKSVKTLRVVDEGSHWQVMNLI